MKEILTSKIAARIVGSDQHSQKKKNPKKPPKTQTKKATKNNKPQAIAITPISLQKPPFSLDTPRKLLQCFTENTA